MPGDGEGRGWYPKHFTFGLVNRKLCFGTLISYDQEPPGVRADPGKYYYAADDLFKRRFNILQMCLNDVPALTAELSGAAGRISAPVERGHGLEKFGFGDIEIFRWVMIGSMCRWNFGQWS